MSDLAAVQQCARRAYEKYIERMGRKPAPMVANFKAAIEKGQLLVMKSDTDLVAFAVCYPRGDCMQLDNIAVDPERQSSGHGRYLLDHIHTLARHEGYRAVTLPWCCIKFRVQELIERYIRRCTEFLLD